MEIPPFIFTVSNQASKQITKIYGRDARVFPNAVDEGVFTVKGDKEIGEKPYLLMVGAESAKFKGISDIILAYEKIKKDFDMDLYWITPERPSLAMKEKVAKVFVSPSQQKISSLFRGASLFICGSTYESFSLPTLEAMACGCPVVTTNNTGVLEYAVDQENALICEMKNPVDMAEKIARVLSSEDIQNKLRSNGLLTAQKYNWETSIKKLLLFYKEVSSYRVQGRNELNVWELTVKPEQFLEEEDFEKLKRYLRVTEADIVKAPVVYTVDKAPPIARWEVIANRKHSDEGKMEQCFCPLQPFNKLQLLSLPGYSPFLFKDYERALAEFQYLYEHQEDLNEKSLSARWIILNLLRLQRKHQAKKQLKEFIKQFPHNTDFHLLNSLIHDDVKIKSNSIETVKLIGDAASYPEFFYDVQNHLLHS
nr:glycosyltransferase family 4 protein [Bacillus sp. ISL-35]